VTANLIGFLLLFHHNILQIETVVELVILQILDADTVKHHQRQKEAYDARNIERAKGQPVDNDLQNSYRNKGISYDGFTFAYHVTIHYEAHRVHGGRKK